MKMEKININDTEYKVIKELKIEDNIYYYTLDINNYNEVVIFVKKNIPEETEYMKVEEREYPILMNKFALK